MIQKFLPLLMTAVLFTSAQAAQQDELISPDVEKALAGSDAAMEQSLQHMNQTLEKVMPEVAQTMSESMAQILNSFTPVMKAMEENRTFSKAASQLAREIEKNLNEVTSQTKQLSAAENIEFTADAPQTGNSQSLKYTFSSSPDLVLNTGNYIQILTDRAPAGKLSVLTLDGAAVPLSKFKIKKINSSSFLIYDDDAGKTTYITGNIPGGFNIRLQTYGESHDKEARKFVDDLFRTQKSQISGNKISLFPETSTSDVPPSSAVR